MALMNKRIIAKLTDFRHQVHQYPEISGKEKNTSQLIIGYLKDIGIKNIFTSVGGYGVIATITGNKPGKTILFRSELDALPLQETGNLNYISKNPAAAHLCGHDGHMAILLGLAETIISDPQKFAGKIVLLFQPAEETAEGAKKVSEDPRIIELRIDHAVALHNIPGYEKGSILLRKGIFASASQGMIIKLKGETSHAGEPFNGKPPTLAMTRIIEDILSLPNQYLPYSNSALATVVYARLGNVAFGTSPGYAEVMATLRTASDEDMKILTMKAEKLVAGQAKLYDLTAEISYTEIFPVTDNDSTLIDYIERSARKAGKKIIWLNKPFPWSEDFGHFTNNFSAVLFGLGSGLKQPNLHNPNYNFPDEIIADGINILNDIRKEIL